MTNENKNMIDNGKSVGPTDKIQQPDMPDLPKSIPEPVLSAKELLKIIDKQEREYTSLNKERYATRDKLTSLNKNIQEGYDKLRTKTHELHICSNCNCKYSEFQCIQCGRLNVFVKD